MLVDCYQDPIHDLSNWKQETNASHLDTHNMSIHLLQPSTIHFLRSMSIEVRPSDLADVSYSQMDMRWHIVTCSCLNLTTTIGNLHVLTCPLDVVGTHLQTSMLSWFGRLGAYYNMWQDYSHPLPRS